MARTKESEVLEETLVETEEVSETKVVAAETTEKVDEMVAITLPRVDDGSPQYLTVAVNGKTWQIERGVMVSVPRTVAEVIRNSERANADAIRYMEAKISEM